MSGRRGPSHTRFLRPSKLGRALRRRVFERRVPHGVALDELPVLHLGTDYGGWKIPRRVVGPNWVCYCVGAGTDISFDTALVRRYGCEVLVLDPTDEARRHFAEVAGGVPGMRFDQVALSASDGPLPMYVAEDPRHCALSAANLQRTRDTVEAEGRTLETLMREHGHRRVDLLKVDLEGSEYEVLDPAAVVRAGVRVLCFELHPTAAPRRAVDFVESFERQGFRPVGRKLTSFTLLRERRTRPRPERRPAIAPASAAPASR